MENLLPHCAMSIYRLTRTASKRAIELASGKPALVKHALVEKPTTVALKEIANGKVESAPGITQSKK
jgi:DNA-directed RNA polymerase omega subunit